MEQTLSELSAQPDDFLSVTVDPVAQSGMQQRWQNQYGRRRLYENKADYYADAPPPNQATKEAQAGQPGLGGQTNRPVISGKTADQPADVAGQKGEPPARTEPAATAEQGNKQTAPLNRFTENNLSRARSYSIPQQRQITRDEPEEQPAAGKDDAAMRDKQRQQSPQPSNLGLQQQSRPLANEAKLRALFVLQLADDAEVSGLPARAPAVTSPADTKEQPAPAVEKKP
jgi:hypothetical protein